MFLTKTPIYLVWLNGKNNHLALGFAIITFVII